MGASQNKIGEGGRGWTFFLKLIIEECVRWGDIIRYSRVSKIPSLDLDKRIA